MIIQKSKKSNIACLLLVVAMLLELSLIQINVLNIIFTKTLPHYHYAVAYTRPVTVPRKRFSAYPRSFSTSSISLFGTAKNSLELGFTTKKIMRVDDKDDCDKASSSSSSSSKKKKKNSLANTSNRSNISQTSQQLPLSFHLISLPALSDVSPAIIRSLWKWKDIVLGDGRDYFVPRKTALTEFSSLLVGSTTSTASSINTMQQQSDDVDIDEYNSSSSSHDGGGGSSISTMFKIEESAIVANCARFDILIVMSSSTTTATTISVNDNLQQGEEALLLSSHQQQQEKAASYLVSKCLLDQLDLYERKKSKIGSRASVILWEGISSFLDLPGMVQVDDMKKEEKITASSPSFDNEDINNDKIQMLTALLNQISDLDKIVQYFCKVACGIQPRPSRPNREVLFRPYSSRDAHIMLQLKRTNEVVTNLKYNKIKNILDTSLNVGKTARDANKIPILKKLKGYDTDGKYSISSPPQLQRDAIEDIKKFAIEPATKKCLQRLHLSIGSNDDNNDSTAEQIIKLRKRADEMFAEIMGMNMNDYTIGGTHKNSVGVDNDAIKMVKKMLHTPCMQLREGSSIDEVKVLSDIRAALLEKKKVFTNSCDETNVDITM